MRAKHGIAGLILATFIAAGPVYGQQRAMKDSGPTGYPERPIRVIAPFPAGGGVDIIARLIGQGLSDAWGQPVVVDNRSGAGGTIGTHLAARAAPDGHTMVLGSVGSVTFVPALYSKLPYDPQKDFTPISLVAIQPFVMTAHPSLPAGSIKEFIALAKSRPNEIPMGAQSGGPHTSASSCCNSRPESRSYTYHTRASPQQQQRSSAARFTCNWSVWR